MTEINTIPISADKEAESTGCKKQQTRQAAGPEYFNIESIFSGGSRIRQGDA